MVNNLPYLNDEVIQTFINRALEEDIGNGDHSSLSSVPENTYKKARLLIKDDGILAGVELARRIFNTIDADLVFDEKINDGEKVSFGMEAFYVKGRAQSILKGERLVLNCMQRMSGIATYTNKLRCLIKNTSALLLDTRKTTPNFRIPEKWAVAIGGGKNHRIGLYDMIMLKDNHIDYAGGIDKAILAARKYVEEKKLNLEIEVETRTLQEVEETVKIGGISRIMLDNMPPDTINEALKIIDGKFETEASGGITEENIQAIAETGVDFISIGALTHSIKSLDMSLKAFE